MTLKSGVKRVYPKGGRWYYAEDLPERNARGRPKQRWHKLSRIADGEGALHQALADLLGKAPAAIGNMPRYIADFRKVRLNALSFGVRKEYERMLEVIAQAFADFDIDEVRPGDVVDFLDLNFAGKATARHHYKARLSTFFSWCVLKDHLKVNPCREVVLRQPPKRKGRMNAGAYWAMYDALPEVGALLLELTYTTRQRPKDIRLLRESQVIGDRIRFEPSKTEESSGEYVEVATSPRIMKIISRLRELRAERLRGRKVIPIGEQRDPYLVLNERGAPFTKSGLNSLWKRARARAGAAARGATTLDIRPYALSQMEKDGHPVEKIREAAAHTTTEMTEHYLNQHRERFSTVVLEPPARPKT